MTNANTNSTWLTDGFAFTKGAPRWVPPASGGGSTVGSVKDYGAKGDGVTDDTSAFNAAIAAGLGVVSIPPGTYKITSTITLPLNTSLIGSGSNATIINYTGSSTAFIMGSTTITGFPVSVYGKIARIRINGAGVAGSIGVSIVKALFAELEDVYVYNTESGFLLDGMDLWVASCNLYDLKTNKVKYGLTLTATATGQVNHINVFGGYFYGQSPHVTGSYGVKVVEGDSNSFHGTAVEDMDTGFWIISNSPLGHRLFGTRTEGINAGREYVVDNGSQRNLFIGHDASVNFNGTGTEGYNTEIADYGYFPTVTSLPSVGSWNRRKIVRLDQSGSLHDNMYMARKKSDGSYEWAALIYEPPTSTGTSSTLISPSGVPFAPTVSDTGTATYAFSGKAYDLFDRTASTTTMSSLVVGGAWSAVGGTWGIISNMAYSASDSNGDRCVMPTLGTGDYTIQCDILGTLNSFSVYSVPQICFRKVDDNNYWKVYMQNGNIWLEVQVAGTNTPITNTATTTSDNTSYKVKVVCSGSNIQVYVNGVKLIDSTGQTQFSTAGICGFRLSKAGSPSTAARFNNLIIT